MVCLSCVSAVNGGTCDPASDDVEVGASHAPAYDSVTAGNENAMSGGEGLNSCLPMGVARLALCTLRSDDGVEALPT